MRVRGDAVYRARAVVLTTGTFLQALMHTGEAKTPGGRAGEGTTAGISARARAAGLRARSGSRPARRRGSMAARSTTTAPSCSRATSEPQPFSFLTDRLDVEQLPCYITYTNEAVHELIRANLHRAPMYSGQINSGGPRYCPSIEDKVVRFADKEQHQLFLEPEGRNTREVYVNGISTSLPRDVQDAMFRLIPGLERAEIMRYGYAVEYDYAPPDQLAAEAGDEARRRAVLRRADQRHDGLRRSGRPGADRRRQRGAVARRARAAGARRATRRTSAC